MNVLIVEDDKLTLSALQYIIEKLGHETFAAESGEEALKIFNKTKVDLIFTDILMPGLSGLSLLSILRNVALTHIPIVLVSSFHNTYSIDASSKLGASYFLAKPVSYSDISLILSLYSVSL